MSDTQQSRWVGWAVFGGVILIIAGAIDALYGLVAILSPTNSYILVADAGTILFDLAGWGWWHLILGLALVVVGVFVLRGASWARITAIILVAINAISQVGFLLSGVQPWLSLVLIALDVFVIFALTVYGKELADK